jgi:diguanylate cyclase (GGDEF)-like protein/PAS domain S-box-containing protein
MLIIDPEVTEILDLNRVASEVFDAPRELFLGQKLDTLITQTPIAKAHIRSVAETGRAQEYEILHHAEGTHLHLHVSNSRIEYRGRPAVLCVHRNISERKALERQLTEQAFHDSLTGLANRVLFRNRVEHAVARLSRYPQTIVVMFLDLDNFKTINDSLGHAAGDQLLVEVAERVSRCMRVTDTVARLGGDEFAILIENAVNPDDSSQVARRLTEELELPFDVEGKEVFVGTSIGIACTSGGDTAEELLRNADAAMYIAKGKGKGRFEIFDASMHEAAMERLDLESDLRRALPRDEFLLEYQPIVDLSTRRIVGVEALIRWDHPERGRIAPGAFIPLAEETGLIAPLGEWVIHEACRQGSEWSMSFPDHPLTVTVNVSGRQIQTAEPELLTVLTQALEATGFPAERLVVEITESVLISNADAMLFLLRKIRELGVRIALDDFGTGYSSLGYLHRFPVDIVKIDRTFTEALERGGAESHVAQAIAALSSALELRTIAEGVATEVQLSRLEEIGCELGQGFHLARPQDASSIAELLEARETPKPRSRKRRRSRR